MPKEKVVVFVPGIMGSVLCLSKEVIWPGSLGSLLGSYKKMPQLMSPDLKATDIIRKFGLVNVYSTLIEDLGRCGFYEDGADPGLYTYPYDWRQSNTRAADGLADLLDANVLKTHGASVEIMLIAHSMGGMVCRYYIESGKYSARPGFARVRNLITIGTPYRGTVLALTGALGLEKRLFLSREQVKELVSDPRYPSLYEMLPPGDEPFVWGTEGEKYDPRGAFEKLELVPENLEAARTFRSGLDLAKGAKLARYFAFYGTRQRTGVHVLLKENSEPEAEQFDDAGDGTVPVWSGQPDGIQSMPVGGEHGTLFRNSDLKTKLGVLLGAPGLLAADVNVQLSVSPKVVEPGMEVSTVLLFPTGIPEIAGEIRFLRVRMNDAGEAEGESPAGKPVTLQYSGGKADKLGLLVRAPEIPGFYRVVFEADSGETAEDELIVQEPA